MLREQKACILTPKAPAGSPVWNGAAPPPVLQDPGIETAAFGEFMGVQFHAVPKRANLLRGRVVYGSARKGYLTPHMRKHLSQCGFDLLPQWGSFRSHGAFSTPVIAATSLVSSLDSDGLWSSREDFAETVDKYTDFGPA